MTRSGVRPLVRALAATAGRAACQRALPLYLGAVLVASVLFEGNGVRPSDVVEHVRASRADRLLSYAAWTIVSLPAVRALLATPSSFFLRSLPVARWRMLALQGAGVLVAELPWAYLWLRGGGLGVGLAAISAAVAWAALVLLRPRRPLEWGAALLLGAVLFFPVHWLLLLGVSLPVAAFGVYQVWLRAPELPEGRFRAWVGGPPALGLASSYAAVLWRQASPQLARAAGFTLLSLVVAYFGVTNASGSADEGVALATLLLSPALILGAAGLAGPLLRAEAEIAWLADVCGTTRAARALGRLAPVALGVGLLAVLHAALLARWLDWPLALGVRLLGAELAAALSAALLVVGLLRWALRGDGGDAGRTLASVGALLLGFVLSLGSAGLWALLGWALLAAVAGASAAAPRRAAPWKWKGSVGPGLR